MSRACAQGQVHQNDLINSGLETTRTWLLRFISFSFAVMLSVGCYFNWIYAFSHLGRKQGFFFFFSYIHTFPSAAWIPAAQSYNSLAQNKNKLNKAKQINKTKQTTVL